MDQAIPIKQILRRLWNNCICWHRLCCPYLLMWKMKAFAIALHITALLVGSPPSLVTLPLALCGHGFWVLCAFERIREKEVTQYWLGSKCQPCCAKGAVRHFHLQMDQRSVSQRLRSVVIFFLLSFDLDSDWWGWHHLNCGYQIFSQTVLLELQQLLPFNWDPKSRTQFQYSSDVWRLLKFCAWMLECRGGISQSFAKAWT